MNKDNNNIFDVTPYFLYDSKDSYTEVIDGQEYYFKHSFNILYELVADELFRLLGINCVNHEMCKIGNKYLLFSKSFCNKENKYYTGKELVLDIYRSASLEDLNKSGIDYNSMNNLNTIWNMLAFKHYNQDDIRQVLIELIKQYTMSVLLLDPDFHSSNWIIEENGKHVKLMPKYDNESAFQSDIFGMEFSVDEFDNTGSSIDSLRYFLECSDSNDCQIVYDLVNQCDEILVTKAFNNVISKYNNIFHVNESETLNNILTIFNNQRNGIIDMIKEMKNKHGR